MHSWQSASLDGAVSSFAQAALLLQTTSLEIFILGLKLSFSIENFNPRPCFSAAREGPGIKKPFSIENFILY